MPITILLLSSVWVGYNYKLHVLLILQFNFEFIFTIFTFLENSFLVAFSRKTTGSSYNCFFANLLVFCTAFTRKVAKIDWKIFVHDAFLT